MIKEKCFIKIAIIGSGISGLGAAYILNEAGHDINVYERNYYIGGHSNCECKYHLL